MAMSSSENVTFDYGLLMCDNFDEVLNGPGSPTTLEALIEQSLGSGRVLLQARGGSGKTTTLERLARTAEASGVAVARLDALAWASAQEMSPRDTAPEKLLSLASPAISNRELSAGRNWLFVVDGLNEVAQSFAASMLEALERLASSTPSVGIIVSDRLNRRALPSGLWALATLSQVSEAQVRELVDDPKVTQDLATLRLPYYLQLALRGDLGSRSEQHRTFLLTHGGVAVDEMPELARAAYLQYQEHGDRRVDLQAMRKDVGDALVERLVVAGTLIPEPTSRFAHHLMHDYLAATHAATRPGLWDSAGLDTLTFKATSMDALAMVLEQAAEAADLLVRQVYDWNFYGAAYLIAEDRRGQRKISPAMELAVITMLGERRFDRFTSTAQQVSDALRVIDSDVARDMLEVETKDEIAAVVVARSRSLLDAAWLDDWVTLYTRTSSEPAQVEDVEILASQDSLLGWTMSNVIRRSPMREAVAQELRRVASHGPTEVARWRAVHALGADPRRGTVDVLLTRLDQDEAIWVRYGAIRSLVEIALIEPNLRQSVFAELAQRVPRLRVEPHLLRELERALMLAGAPRSWSQDSAVVVEQLWVTSGSVEEQDRWRGLGAALRELAGAAR